MDVLREIILEDVISEQCADSLTVSECFCHAERLSDSLWLVLNAVGEATAKFRARAEALHEISRELRTRDEHNFPDACIEEDLEWIEHEWFPSNRKQALMGVLREGEEAGAFAAADEDAFHEVLGTRY